jgi:PAS domain S-box-containing protein
MAADVTPGAGAARGTQPGALVILLTAATYLAAAKLGLSMAVVGAPVSPVWPPTGIALAAVVLFGARWTAPGIALGAFFANASASEPLATAAAIAVGNTLEAVVGGRLLARAGVRPTLEGLHDVLALALFAAGASTVLSATIGVAALCAGGMQPWTHFLTLWSTWWIGDVLGALVVAPVLLVWATPDPAPSSVGRRLEAVMLALVTGIVGLAVFAVHRAPPLAVYPLHYTTFSLVIWAALRFGQRGTASVTGLVSGLAIASTLHGSGPFVMATPTEGLLLLQVFMGVVAITGLVLGAAITERDVSRRRRTLDYESLQVSEERLRLALDAGRMGVWDWNILTGDVRWSENLEAIHGLTPGTFGGDFTSFQAIVHPDDRERVGRAIDAAVASRTGYDVEFRNLRGDGTIGWISGKGTVFCDETGRAVRMLGVAMDVTERRGLDEDLEAHANELALADRRKDEFLAMLAHELRNPLAPLSTALHLLRVDARSDEHKLAIAERQAQQLTRLVDDLLDVSRITQGKVALRAEAVTLQEVVARALETARPAIEARRQDFRVAIPAEPLGLQADPARLAQVVANLLDNATKYTPIGGEISIDAERIGGTVVLRVRDTGAGLAPDLLPNVFDLFVQGDRSLARTRGGLGIGLTIVRRLVELHGGRVEARSAGPGRGSEFVVELPVVDAPAIAGRDAGAPATPATATAKLKVLVVEDNQDAAEVLATVVELWGHDVRMAFDAQAALEAVERWRPQVVVSDLGLPRMDGFELARRLRRMSPDDGALLIALSGYGRDEDRQAALAAGFDHHLVKPPDLALLAALLDRLAAGLRPEHRDVGG